MKFLMAFILFSIFPATVFAQDYIVDKDESGITFSGTHAGNDFDGEFEEWDATIRFNPENLQDSFIEATFHPASAKTGNAMYDGTLPQADWFDVKNHPEAIFKSTSITQNDSGAYSVNGDLTIRGITRPVEFDFTLSDLDTAPVTAEATLIVDRLAYDIGKKSDATAEWVSQNIDIQLNIIVNPAP